MWDEFPGIQYEHVQYCIERLRSLVLAFLQYYRAENSIWQRGIMQ
jgi:hypothetical protein